MPLYSFKCAKCGEEKEVIQKYSDKPPKCCRKQMTRTFPKTTSFELKGTGWYKDGYR